MYHLGDVDEIWGTKLNYILKKQFDSQCYQIFREIVGVEQDPLSLVSFLKEKVAVSV
jgi:hypothetical protein